MLKQILVTSAIAASLVLVGCSSAKKETAPPPPPPSSSGMSSYGASDSNVSGTGMGVSAAELASKKTVYFEYDSSDLTAEGQSIVSLWSKYLSNNPSVRVRLEGNADERGTREYNVALGEHRANAVQAAMTSAGVASSQLSVISYGEEHPAAEGHDESAYTLNRRVDIVLQ